MTIIETIDYVHGIAGYENTDPDDGIVFVTDCGMAALWPYQNVRNDDDARVDCPECIAGRLNALRDRIERAIYNEGEEAGKLVDMTAMVHGQEKRP